MPNLFENIPQNLPEELTDVILQSANVRVERIVSKGHRSPNDFWYDQDEHEWVFVLQGEAVLSFEGNHTEHLVAGDHLFIPAHQRHRVDWTSSDTPTIWIAVFFHEDPRST